LPGPLEFLASPASKARLFMTLAIAIFLAALVIALWGGRRGLRALVVLAIVLSPLRGGLLALADNLPLGNPDLAVNALVPALIAAIALGCVAQKRPRLDDFPRPLLIALGLIAVAAALSFLAKVVSLKLYGIGLAQYFVYPTLALAIWPLLEPGDSRRLSRLMIAMGGVVAITVLLQAAGVEGFIQAASAQVDGLAADRYAGVTGSYLHTSAFLGVAAVLAMGEFARVAGWKERLGATAVLAAILSGQVLTFSRSGVVIAAIGIIVLFLFSVRGARLRFAVLVMPAVVIAVAAGSIGGVAPDAAGARVTSGFNPKDDPGNKLRTESFEKGFGTFGDGSITRKAIGHGLAATGNARQLVDDGPQETVESYFLKLLVETGVIGLILIGGFLVWAGVFFAQRAWHSPNPWTAGIAAAGLGLSLYNVIYPALETQILALTWWLLLALCLKTEQEASAPSEPRSEPQTVTQPQMASSLASR
jgi:O-antigen ligase